MYIAIHIKKKRQKDNIIIIKNEQKENLRADLIFQKEKKKNRKYKINRKFLSTFI